MVSGEAMNKSDVDLSAPELLSITKALRFALVAIVLGISYLNVRLAFSIPWFQNIYHDMLGNKPLPPETAFVVQAHSGLVVLSFALPLFAVLSLFLCRRSVSIYIVGIVIIAVVGQLVFTWHAVAVPFFMIALFVMQGTH